MRKIITAAVCLAFLVCAASLAAQSSTTSTLTSKDSGKIDAHDRPIGGINIKLPAPGGQTNPNEPGPPPPPGTPPMPPTEGDDLPPVETPPDPPPPEEPPTYYGEPVQGKFTFVLDASGSMAGSKIATVRAETVSTIQNLTEDDEFDCVAYGSQFPESQSYSAYMWGAILPATSANKASAISWVNGSSLNPGGMTPTYAVLKKACQVYPAELTKFFLLTDGYPNITGGASQILADFPGWWSKFHDTELICICIGGGGADFMQQLAAEGGGSYIAA